MFDIKTRDGSVNVAVGKSVDVHLSWNNPAQYGTFGLNAEWDKYDLTVTCGLACVRVRVTVLLRPFVIPSGTWEQYTPSDASNAQETASEGKSE